ncbi:MAG: hypothetical protein Q9184_003973 [Pyrenodesmia sp. 2 TL-2023]
MKTASTHRNPNNIMGMFKKRKVRMAFRVKPIASMLSLMRSTSQTTPSNPDPLLEALSHDGPSPKAPLEASLAQAPPPNAPVQASHSSKDSLMQHALDNKPPKWPRQSDLVNPDTWSPAPSQTLPSLKTRLGAASSHASRRMDFLHTSSSDLPLESKPSDLQPAPLQVELTEKDILKAASSRASLRSPSRRRSSQEISVKAPSPEEALSKNSSSQRLAHKFGKASIGRLQKPLPSLPHSSRVDDTMFDPLRAPSHTRDNVTTVQGTDSAGSGLGLSLTMPFCARVERAVLSVLGEPASPQVSRMTSCLLEWELFSFMQKDFDSQARISDVVTLVGALSPYNVCATTCSKYISQTWPEVGPLLLRVIEGEFQPSDSEASWPELSLSGYIDGAPLVKGKVETQDLHIRLRHSSTSAGNPWVLDVIGSAKLQVKVAQALCWLAATFRSSPIAGIAESRVSFRPSGACYFSLSLENLVPLPDTETCWYPLFTHTSMAVDYPVPQRKEGIGLEIAPLLMASLAGIVMVVELEGGLILKGLSTALIPVKYCNDGAAIQWHLLHTESADGFLGALGTNEDFLKVKDPAILFQKTAYLGWCKHANILLGTNVLDYTAVNWSSPAPEQSKITVSGFQLGLASNGLGIFGPAASMNFAIAKSQRTRYVDIEQQLEDRLKLSIRKPALVYDTLTQRAWLVPLTSLLLQMMHLRHHQLTSRAPCNNTSTMPYADSTVEGGYAAYQVLSAHLQPESATTALGNQAAWRNSLARLYTGLDMALKNASDFKTRPRQDEDEIFGFELLDIVLADSPFRFSQRKVQKQSGGWAPIGQHVGYVLFCSGLGNALVPSSEPGSNQICGHCSRLPTGCDYLSAYIPCFQETLVRQGEHAVSKLLSDREYEESLYHDCIGTNRGRCVQPRTYDSLFEASKEASTAITARATNGSLHRWIGGAIVIGKRIKLLKRNLMTPAINQATNNQAANTIPITPNGNQATVTIPFIPNDNQATNIIPITPNGNQATVPTKAPKNLLRRVLYRLS